MYINCVCKIYMYISSIYKAYMYTYMHVHTYEILIVLTTLHFNYYYFYFTYEEKETLRDSWPHSYTLLTELSE